MNTNQRAVQMREKKIQLVRENPNTAIVYMFKSQVIKEKFSKNVREAASIKDATIDLWGYLLDDTDKNTIEEKFNKVVEIAKKIIDLSNKVKSFDYASLMTKSAGEKIRFIQEKDNPLVDVFIPKSKEDDILFEALFRIDAFDADMKRSEYSKEWMETLKEFEKALKELEETAFTIFKEKIRAKHLTPYQELRFVFKMWLKGGRKRVVNQAG